MVVDEQAYREGRVAKDIGGQPVQTYWTPDGRMMKAMPDIHEFAKKDKAGKVVSQGTRDANLDKGWLQSKPLVLKLYCPACDKWHDTPVEVKVCIVKKKAFQARWDKAAKKEVGKDGTERLDKVESDVSEIKDMLRQLLSKGA